MHLDHQAASASKGHLGGSHGGFKDHRLTRAHGGEGRDSGAILIAKGQVEEGILKGAEPETGKGLAHLWPHALQGA